MLHQASSLFAIVKAVLYYIIALDLIQADSTFSAVMGGFLN